MPDADLTLLFYSACQRPEPFAKRMLAHLLEVSAPGLPIVSVTYKPMELGHNICVGDLGYSAWNIYWQVLLGAKAATTPFVACCEDDYYYSSDHWQHRPPDDTFAYDLNRWTLDDGGLYFRRSRAVMAMCIASRALMVETLEERFAKYPTPTHDRFALRGWGEPGRYEGNLKLPQRKMEHYEAAVPSMTFNHRKSLGGKRKIQPTDRMVQDLPPWGEARAVWAEAHAGC